MLSTKLSLFFSAIGSASITAMVKIAEGSGPWLTFAWAAGAGLFGAGVSWGLMRGAVKRSYEHADTAHRRIDAEKRERKESQAELKGDILRQFERMERNTSEQTRVLVDTIKNYREA